MSTKGESGANHQALYRKYRPSSLKDVVGQDQVTEVLRRSLEQGKIGHAYLLTGPRGVGKTSIARILAHEINQLPYDNETTHLDIIEIDAASNNGVEDVRDLRDKVQIAPVSAAKKVYIIDEVHMLSKPAFNALLKTLEEPPAHVVFILATTDLHKVPATIISRTQHFAFRSISPTDLAAQLRAIADAEHMKADDDALAAIAARGDGSFRDSISLLDQLSSFADSKQGITLDLVQSTLGLPPRQAVEELLQAVAGRDIAAVIAKLDALEVSGVQASILADQLIHTLRDKLAAEPQLVTLLDALLEVPSSSQPQLKLLTTLITAARPRTTNAAASTVQAVVSAPITSIAPLPSFDFAEAKSARRSLATGPVGVSAPSSEKSEILSEAGTAPLAVTRAGETAGELVAAPLSEEDVPVRASQAPQAGLRPPVERPLKKDGAASSERKSAPTADFDWQKVVSYAKKNLIALHSVLAKCDAELDGDTLTLYTGRKFNKTKLDEAKYLTQLHEALASSGYDGLTIATLPTAKPPADEQLANIAAMMGGGEEVSLDEA